MMMQPNLKNSTAVICQNCNGEVFEEKVHIRKISKLFTGGPKDEFASIPILKCNNCGEILMDMMPNGLIVKEGNNSEPKQDNKV